MARPLKEGMDYFPHDTDAASDEKVETLMSLYGPAGYAFYFILLERIYRNPEFELDVSDAETRQILSRKIAVTQQEFEKMIVSAVKYRIFDPEEYEKRSVLTSNGIKKRTVSVVEKRKRMRQKYDGKNIQNKEECAFKDVSAAETEQKQGRNEAETAQSKVKKSKVKNSKVNIISAYTGNENLQQAIYDFAEMRVKNKKPMTDKALQLMLKKLSGMAKDDSDKIAILEQSTMNCWQSIYELKKGGAANGAYRQQPRTVQGEIEKDEFLDRLGRVDESAEFVPVDVTGFK